MNKDAKILEQKKQKSNNRKAQNLDKIMQKYTKKPLNQENFDNLTGKNVEEINYKFVWKNSLFKVLKIIFIIVVFSIVSFVLLFLFFPDKCAGVCEFLGANRAQERCLEIVFERSKEPYDLYNLILVQDEHKNYLGELQNVEKMISLDDFEIFCDTLDRENLRNVSTDKYGYVGNSRAFFLGKQVKCQIFLNENANALVCKNLNSNNLTENTFAVAVRTILNNDGFDSLTKKSKISDLFLTWDSSFSGNDVETLVLNRIEILKQVIDELLSSNKIIAGFSLFEMSNALLNARIMQGDEIKIEEARELYNQARQIYINLL